MPKLIIPEAASRLGDYLRSLFQVHGIPQAKVDGLVGKGMGLYDLRRPSVRCLWALAALHTNFNQALGRSTSKDERRAHHRALGEEEGNSLTLGADVSLFGIQYSTVL